MADDAQRLTALTTEHFGLAGARSQAAAESASRSALFLGNLLWLILAGWWLALGHLITGILLAITIIGIPLALANFKLIPISLWPFGREIVPTSVAHQLGEPLVTVPHDRSPGRQLEQ